MKFKITYANGFVQIKELTNCPGENKNRKYIGFNYLIYKAIEDGSFTIDRGEYGQHKFKAEEI